MALALTIPALTFFVAFGAIAIVINALIIHWLSKVFRFSLVGFIRALEVSALVGAVNLLISLGMFFFQFESYLVDFILLVAVIAATYLFTKLIYKEPCKVSVYFSLAVFAIDLAVGILAGLFIVFIFNLLNIPFF